jgi:hypothetical protein
MPAAVASLSSLKSGGCALERASAGRKRRQKMKPHLPPGYYLEHYPNLNLIVLRRRDGYFVAAFSTRGVEREVIEKVAWQDFRGEPTPEAVLWQRN